MLGGSLEESLQPLANVMKCWVMWGADMKNEKSLKPVQLSALKLIAMGTPDYQVAERLDVSAMTIYRWRRLPEFEAKLNAVTSSGLEEISKTLNATALTAVETLQEILCDLSQPVPIRMRAALGVLGAMPAVNGALEKGLRHRAADFDLTQRFGVQGYTYDSSGNTCGGGGEGIVTV